MWMCDFLITMDKNWLKWNTPQIRTYFSSLFQVTDCDGDEAVDLKIIVGVTVTLLYLTE